MRTRVRELTPRATVPSRISVSSLPTSIESCAAGASTFAPATPRINFIQKSISKSRNAYAACSAQAGGRAGFLAGRVGFGDRAFFEALGLHRLRGTIQYPGVA